MYLFQDPLAVQKIKKHILYFNFGLGFSLIGPNGPIESVRGGRWDDFTGKGAKRKLEKYAWSFIAYIVSDKRWKIMMREKGTVKNYL